jgi:hypothetical protein
MIVGPEEVVSKFVDYVNEEGFASYWAAIQHLMEESSKLIDVNQP